MEDCLNCDVLEDEIDRLYDRVNTLRELALEALEGQESWVRDQYEGTSYFKGSMEDIDKLRKRIMSA